MELCQSHASTRLITTAAEDENAIISYQQHKVLIGNRKWIKEKNFIEIPSQIEDKMISQEKLGHTALLAAVDGKFFIVQISQPIIFFC